MIKKILGKIKEKSMVKNSLIIMIGQSISSIVGFLNTFLLLQGIGINGIGMITIIQSYCSLFNGLFNFQSYNAIIKFGAEALEKKKSILFKQYLKQAFLQDVFTAILAFVIGTLCIKGIGKFMNWDNSIIFYSKIYMITTIFNITGSVQGFLRLYNEFIVISKVGIYTAVIKTIFLIVGMTFGYNFSYYILVEILVVILNNIYMFILAYKLLKKQGYEDFLSVKTLWDREFTIFNLYNNIVSTIDIPTGQIVNLLIDKLLGVSQVGVYSVLVKFGGLVTRVTGPITQALYPELAKMVAQRKKDKAYKIVRDIGIYTFTIGIIGIIICTITSNIWLGWFMPFNTHNLISLNLYLSYIVMTSAVGGVHLLFTSMNLVKYNLPIVLICNCIYLLLVYILGKYMGLPGIIMGLLIQATMVVVIKLIIIRKVERINNE